MCCFLVIHVNYDGVVVMCVCVVCVGVCVCVLCMWRGGGVLYYCNLLNGKIIKTNNILYRGQGSYYKNIITQILYYNNINSFIFDASWAFCFDDCHRKS